MMKKIIGLLFIAVMLASCGSGRSAKKIATKDAEAAKIIKQHYNNEIQFKTLTGKLKASYRDAVKSQSVSLSFRMEKDKAIWMSASVLGFPVAKAYITPEKVSYYEKMGKTYFEGDFSLLSDWLGTPLDFQKLQNLLIGQAVYDLRTETYQLSSSAKGYQFLPTEQGDIKKMFLIDPGNYKTSAQQLAQEKESRSVTITYSDYQKVSGKLFPEEIKIIANEGGKSTNIELTYRSVEIDEEVHFPFEIPSGYDEISVK